VGPVRRLHRGGHLVQPATRSPAPRATDPGCAGGRARLHRHAQHQADLDPGGVRPDPGQPVPGRGADPVPGHVGPDVATSTNLAGFINRVGVFAPAQRRSWRDDPVLRWAEGPKGQHIELGISEMNLFLLLGQLGLAWDLSGQALLRRRWPPPRTWLRRASPPTSSTSPRWTGCTRPGRAPCGTASAPRPPVHPGALRAAFPSAPRSSPSTTPPHTPWPGSAPP
jgi:hypothetical protein